MASPQNCNVKTRRRIRAVGQTTASGAAHEQNRTACQLLREKISTARRFFSAGNKHKAHSFLHNFVINTAPTVRTSSPAVEDQTAVAVVALGAEEGDPPAAVRVGRDGVRLAQPSGGQGGRPPACRYRSRGISVMFRISPTPFSSFRSASSTWCPRSRPRAAPPCDVVKREPPTKIMP